MQTKTFFLQNQETSKCEFVEWQFPKNEPFVNLQELLERVPKMHQKSFKLYNPEQDEYILLGNFENSDLPYVIQRDLLSLSIIIIKFEESFQANEEEFQESEQTNKKQRSRQRSIKEVIELVEKWRKYHDYQFGGKKRTLQEAARLVGISKKSLDDYYYQLRVGEKHKFDFSSHLDDKIGVLRAFLKLKQPERKANGKNVRQPKKLKIIQQFSKKGKKKIVNNFEKVSSKNTEIIKQAQPISHEKCQEIKKIESPHQQVVDIVHSNHDIFQSFFGQQQQFWGSPFTPMSQQKFKHCQQNFYNQFGFTFEDPIDPYLSFTNFANQKSHVSED